MPVFINFGTSSASIHGRTFATTPHCPRGALRVSQLADCLFFFEKARSAVEWEGVSNLDKQCFQPRSPRQFTQDAEHLAKGECKYWDTMLSMVFTQLAGKHQRISKQIYMQICLRVLCERGLRMKAKCLRNHQEK